MSVSRSPSETSSGCSSAAPAGFCSLRLRDNAFPFSAQPLVYYAAVPEVYGERQKGHEKSDKPNCFVKAFRWYTQEHGARKKSTEREAKGVGFATWLDHKYQQYLSDSQLKNASFKSEAYVPSLTANQEPATHISAKPKGFQRVLRRPNAWIIRDKNQIAVCGPIIFEDFRRFLKDLRINYVWHFFVCYFKGIISESVTCNSSWQILLKPKSLSNLESETCAKKQSTCWAPSRATVTSSDTQMTVRSYSRRLGALVHEVTDLDIGNDIKENTKKIDGLDSQNTYVLDKNCTEATNSKIKVKCECPVETNEMGQNYRTDASTQYDPNKNIEVKHLDNATTTRGTSTASVIPGPIKNTCPATPKAKHIQINTGDKTKLKSSCACEHHAPVLCRQCHRACKNIDNTREQIFENHQERQRSVYCCHMRPANGSAQTSDFEITPENVAYGLPLLLRILSPRQ